MQVEKIVMCSGKVYYDLIEARKKTEDEASRDPAPGTVLSISAQGYSRSTRKISRTRNSLVWAQEEPQNMGGWTFVEPRLENLLDGCQRPKYVGRTPQRVLRPVRTAFTKKSKRRL